MMFWRFGHPSLTKLHRWVAGEDESISKHLATCELCAQRLDPLLDESSDSIRAALLQLLAVPQQLPDRLRSDIDKRLSNQRDLALIGEFFGLPLRTAKILTSTDQGDD